MITWNHIFSIERKILALESCDISQKLRQTKCWFFKIWRLKFTVVPKKSTWQFGKICVLVNFIKQNKNIQILSEWVFKYKPSTLFSHTNSENKNSCNIWGERRKKQKNKAGQKLPKWTACHYFSVEKVSTHSSDE